MGLSDYWNKNRVETVGASFSYVSAGSSSDSSDDNESQECIDSSECASGWACVGGECRQLDTGAGGGSYGDTSGCGGDDNDGGGGGGGCGASIGDSSDGSGCTKSGCGGTGGGGGGGNADDCCGGERCCRNGSCTCGPCPPPPPSCNKWCDDYLKANGESGEGCTEECGECEECDLNDDGNYACLEKNGGPCNCPGSFCSGKCATCTKDGVCEDDCNNCQTCYTTFKECTCGTVKKTCCYSACDQSKGYGDCRDSIKCDDACPPPPGGGGGGGGGDPCAGECRTTVNCDGTPPPCPPNSSCSESGSISVGGKSCTLTTVCDMSDVPDSCKECDCNCDNDCPACYICDDSGECVPDPECNKYFVEYAWYAIDYETSYANDDVCTRQQVSYPGFSHEIGGFNGGKLGDDPTGISWRKVGGGPCPGCRNCSSSTGGKNVNGYVDTPNGVNGPIRLDFCSCTAISGTPRYVYYKTGVVVGIGDTHQEAVCDAKAKDPLLNVIC